MRESQDNIAALEDLRLPVKAELAAAWANFMLALLDAKGVHPGRSARSHLRTMAATHNITASRVDEAIEMTGLAGVASKRVGGFSLGMGQRLGIAAALLQIRRSVE